MITRGVAVTVLSTGVIVGLGEMAEGRFIGYSHQGNSGEGVNCRIETNCGTRENRENWILQRGQEARRIQLAQIDSEGGDTGSRESAGRRLDEVGLATEDIENSPVLRRWLEEPPDILGEIRNDPAVPMRVRVGLASNREWTVGVEDITLYDRVTLSGDYRRAFDEQSDEEYGAALRYYVLPRGSYFNVAPQLGFRHLELNDGLTEGLLAGVVGTIALAPGAADLVVGYGLVEPFSGDEATVGSVTAAYHVTESLRLAGQVNWRHTVFKDDISVGVMLEWGL